MAREVGECEWFWRDRHASVGRRERYASELGKRGMIERVGERVSCWVRRERVRREGRRESVVCGMYFRFRSFFLLATGLYALNCAERFCFHSRSLFFAVGLVAAGWVWLVLLG